MRDVFFVVRFFRIVTPIPRLMALAFAAVGSVAAVLVVVDPPRAATATIPLLLLQLFAASSGFMVPARRGHYDVLLTSGHDRLLVAGVHWIMSILPGIVSWWALALIELTITAGTRMTLMTAGTLIAFALVSTVPWAATVALPRFTAAIGWLLCLTLLAVTTSPGGAMFGIAGHGSSGLETSMALTLYPAGLIGERLSGPDGVFALPAVILVSGSMLCALTWVRRQDIPLEAAQ